MNSDVAEIRILYPIDVGRAVDHPYKETILVKFAIDIRCVFVRQIVRRFNVTRRKDTSRDRQAVRHKDKVAFKITDGMQVLFDLRYVLMSKRLVGVERIHPLW